MVEKPFGVMDARTPCTPADMYLCMHTAAREAIGFVDHKKMDLSIMENHWSIVRVYYLYLFFLLLCENGSYQVISRNKRAI